MKYLPLTCFALIPFGVWGQNIFFGQAATFILSAVLIVFLYEQAENYKLNLWIKAMGAYLSLWLAATFLLLFLNKVPTELFMAAMESTLFVLAGIIFYLSVYRGSVPLDKWADVICVVSFLEALLGIMQRIGYDPFYIFLSNFVELVGLMPFNTPVGTLGNPNFLAAYLAVSLPFFFRKGWNKLIPVILVALIITKTTTAIGAAIIGSIYFLFGWQGALISIIPVFALYAIKYNGHITTNARVEYWLDAWKSTSHSWQTFLFGWGPGITWRPGNMLHSEYVNTFFNFGIIGTILFLGYLLTRHRDNRMLFSALIILCIGMIGNHSLHLATAASLILVIVAMIDREQKLEEKETVL